MLRVIQASKCVETDVTDLRKFKLVNELADLELTAVLDGNQRLCIHS